jgi:hypothetical protein
MIALKDFERSLSKNERRVFLNLSSPVKIQAFLDKIPYYDDDTYHSPLSVLRDRKACCLDGALFAAAALRWLGHPPVIVELIAENDDDHIIAIYKQNSFFGAIAKSNFVGLRFREPVYRSLRELIMSYFELYYNLHGKKTLRRYTAPLSLKPFDKINWMLSDDNLETIAQQLDKIRRVSLLTPRMVRNLSTVDKRSYEAGMLGVDTSAIYKPGRKGSQRKNHK